MIRPSHNSTLDLPAVHRAGPDVVVVASPGRPGRRPVAIRWPMISVNGVPGDEQVIGQAVELGVLPVVGHQAVVGVVHRQALGHALERRAC